MRLFFALLLGLCLGSLQPGRADDHLVQEFSGTGSTTTALFTVHDRWEVRWNSLKVVSVAVMAADGTIVTGGAGVLRGSLFVPNGGQYYFKVSDGTEPAAAPSTNVPTATPVSPAASTNSPAAKSSTNAAPSPAATPPAVIVPDNSTDAASSTEPAVSWHLQVVELGSSVASDQALTVYTPYFIVPDSAVTPVVPPPPPPPPKLTDDQLRALVTIKGDNAQGSGFFAHLPDGDYVVTHLHLLAANPNIQILTSTGAVVTTTALKGAVNRDLALFAIKDDHYYYLSATADIAKTVATGDSVVIPDPSVPGSAVTPKAGKIVNLGPDRVDIDAGLGPDCAGVPALATKDGGVVGMVTAAERVDVSSTLAKAWSANPAPGSDSIIPYYALRLDGVTSWQAYNPAQFQTESQFLHRFHDDTRCLDSFLNGRRSRGNRSRDGAPDSRYYQKNDAMRAAMDTYNQQANGADENQRLDAARELLFDLGGVADKDVETLKSMTDLYAFDATWAQEELAYRAAIKKELDTLGDDVVRLDSIARTR